MLGWFKRKTVNQNAPAPALDIQVNLKEAARNFARGQLDAASSLLKAVLAEAPRHPGALHLQGVLLACQGLLPEALESFKRSLAGDGNNPDTHADFGNALLLSGYRDSAELEYRKAIKLAPQRPLFHCALANLLRDSSQQGEAIDHYQMAIRLDPNDAEAVIGLAVIFYRQLDYQEVVRGLVHLQTLRALSPAEYAMLGESLLNVGRPDESETALMAGLSIAPENPWLQYHLGVLLLVQGNWREGFRLFEKRTEAVRLGLTAGNASLRQWFEENERRIGLIRPWSGEPLNGKKILIWAEQGYGDTIQLLRLLPMLCDKGADRVVLLAGEPLLRLVKEGANVECQVAMDHEAGQAFDFQCSIMSLPYRLELEPSALPNNSPYLTVPAPLVAGWAKKLNHLSGLKVGVVWQGNPAMQLDVLRSMRLTDLAPLFALDGISWVNLQKGAGADLAQASRLPVTDLMDDCVDFMETAALIENLDLVLAVDTSVSHLAGALNKPVWLLNRYESDWRRLWGSDTTLWYSSMRIFTQERPRSWDGLVERVCRELSMLVGKESSAEK